MTKAKNKGTVGAVVKIENDQPVAEDGAASMKSKASTRESFDFLTGLRKDGKYLILWTPEDRGEVKRAREAFNALLREGYHVTVPQAATSDGVFGRHACMSRFNKRVGSFMARPMNRRSRNRKSVPDREAANQLCIKLLTRSL